METLRQIINSSAFQMGLIIIGVVIVLTIIAICFIKMYNKFREEEAKNKGLDMIQKLEESGVGRIEEILVENKNRIETLEHELQVMKQRADHIEKNVAQSIQKVAVMRYNAFQGSTNDMSYSIAFLDYYNDGVIISSIFSPEGAQTYSKPIMGGKATYHLSTEESQVLMQAMTIQVEDMHCVEAPVVEIMQHKKKR